MKPWPTEEGKFVHDYHVTAIAADIDTNDHVNNVVYIRWVQEAAEKHWQLAAGAELVDSIVWVVMSHEIEYKKPAHLGEALIVKTWVEQGSALTSERHCRIVREADGALIARVKTLWCAVNPANGKPRRLPSRVKEIFVR
jgi:acyl-CoA thioester hydrolase